MNNNNNDDYTEWLARTQGDAAREGKLIEENQILSQNVYILSIDCDWVSSPSQYQDLLSYFTEKVKDVEEVYFSGDHQFHYPHIPSNSILVNIDHHHDMGYQDFQYQNMEKGLMDEASWVLALIRFKKIQAL